MIETDDPIYRVDNTFLGPTGYTLPFPVKFVSLGVGLGVFAVCFVISRSILHLDFSYKMLLGLAGFTYMATARITKTISPERPLRSVLRAAWNDLTAPRTPKTGTTAELSLRGELHRLAFPRRTPPVSTEQEATP